MFLHQIRERKSKNLIIYRLWENDRENEDEQAIADEYQVDEILGILKIDHVPYVKVTRLGRKEADKTRPLLVEFHTEDDRERVIRNAYNLKNNETYNISICRDRTREQRIKDKEAYLARRQAQGNDRSDERHRDNRVPVSGAAEGEQGAVAVNPSSSVVENAT